MLSMPRPDECLMEKRGGFYWGEFGSNFWDVNLLTESFWRMHGDPFLPVVKALLIVNKALVTILICGFLWPCSHLLG
jgi:hypothetical protein